MSLLCRRLWNPTCHRRDRETPGLFIFEVLMRSNAQGKLGVVLPLSANADSRSVSCFRAKKTRNPVEPSFALSNMAEETYPNRILGGFGAAKWRGVFRRLFSDHQLPSESLKPGLFGCSKATIMRLVLTPYHDRLLLVVLAVHCSDHDGTTKSVQYGWGHPANYLLTDALVASPFIFLFAVFSAGTWEPD